MVDYVITSPDYFSAISKFEVHDFNEYSNHSPISLTLKIKTNTVITKNKESVFYKWKPEHKEAFLNDLSSDMHILDRLLIDGIDRNCEPDDKVSNFSKFITDRANTYFEKHSKTQTTPRFSTGDFKEKKIWFNDECKNKREIYKEKLYNFNLNRNAESRKIMLDAKKDYKYYCRSCKLKYSYEQGRRMNEMRKKQPRQFWKTFKRNKRSQSESVPINDFFNYFKSLASDGASFENQEVNDFLQDFNRSTSESTFCELDEPITKDEIRNAAKQLNTNKACSLDTIINEYFKESIDILLNPLETLFNYILNKQTFPKQWSKGVIIPIYKKGDARDPTNYRGITLVSCFGKLFTTIISERLAAWASMNNIISDAQFGFKSDYSTVDAIFILESLLSKYIRDKKRLYCSFIDLKRAFDSVYRDGLWYKLLKQGLNGKVFQIIRSIYSDVKSCVKNFGSISEFFDSNVGLLQGEVISPFLFSLFINDLEIYLHENPNATISLDQLSLYLLLFADDAVIFSESVEGLQTSLDSLESYCKKWNLQVNISKTKIMVFRKGGNLRQNEKWTYAGENIEIVSNFNYLGIVLSSGGSFVKATNTLVGKALKAMHALLSITKEMQVPVKIMFNLFDSFVGSILNYSCEVWGFATAENIERVHRKFCKWLVNVKMSTKNLYLAGEFGGFPLYIGRNVRIVKYWLNLHSSRSSNCILQTLNKLARNEVEMDPSISSWTAKVKLLLEHNGFPDVWMYPESVNINMFIPIFQNRLRDVFITEWNHGLSLSSSSMLYKEMKQSFEMSPYLLIIQNKKHRNAIAKLRLSSHQLNIETGRHTNIERLDRKCNLCNLDDLEDEYHFTLICPIYKDLRIAYIQKYFYRRPNVMKSLELLNSTRPKILNNLAIFILKAFKLRQNILNANTDASV